METEMKRITETARKHDKLQTLVHHINIDSLKEKHEIAMSKKATGVDGVTKDMYSENLEDNLQNLVDRMKRQAYKPQDIRRAYIPKEGSKEKRGLGIPAYEDKLVQGVMADVLNAIYEVKFLDISYGFRPNRSCHGAIKRLGNIIERNKVNYIVDADIKGFFDNVDHEWLIKFLEHDIEDKNFLRIIKRFLNIHKLSYFILMIFPDMSSDNFYSIFRRQAFFFMGTSGTILFITYVFTIAFSCSCFIVHGP